MGNDMKTVGVKSPGIKACITGRIMNIIHSAQYRKIIRSKVNALDAVDSPTVLDIGCGGGVAVKIFLAADNRLKAYGTDISPDMAELAARVNKNYIASGRAQISCGDVSALPYEDGKFHMATAFDTINFWPDIKTALSEVRRVLKDGGVFLIVNGYPKEGTKWWDFVKYKSDAEYRRVLEENGFKSIETDINNNTIIIKAQKD